MDLLIMSVNFVTNSYSHLSNVSTLGWRGLWGGGVENH